MLWKTNELDSGKFYVDYLYEKYKNKDFLYDVFHQHICSTDLHKEKEKKKSKFEYISECFYEYFGYDLICSNSKS